MRVIGWVAWICGAVVVGLGLIVLPVYAIVSFATDHPGDGWKTLGLFAGLLAYALLLAFDVIRRPWARR